MSLEKLKADLTKKKPIYGVEVALKGIKNETLSKVYISFNCHRKKDLVRLCKVMGVEVIELGKTNAELGILCKKPFSISVISFK